MQPFHSLRTAVARAFETRRLQSFLLVFGLGSALGLFYAIALPAEQFGAFAFGALAFITPEELFAALVIGYGTMLAIAINLSSNAARTPQSALSFGGAITALLPSSLCCTTLIPSALAALGASAPAVLRLTGRFQGFFATYSAEFIGVAVIAVLGSLWLAVRTSNTACPIPIGKGIQ